MEGKQSDYGPGLPRVVPGEGSKCSLDLSWDHPKIQRQKIEKYEVHYRESDKTGRPWLAIVKPTEGRAFSITVTDHLLPDRKYDIWVTGVMKNGNRTPPSPTTKSVSTSPESASNYRRMSSGSTRTTKTSPEHSTKKYPPEDYLDHESKDREDNNLKEKHSILGENVCESESNTASPSQTGEGSSSKQQKREFRVSSVLLCHLPEKSNNFVESFEYGSPNPQGRMRHEHKTLLLVGESGSGKTTLINAMVNYIFGVKVKDNHRYQLVKYPTKQSRGSTAKITCYTLHHQKQFQIPFSLTIIDTPGFGGDGGKEADDKLSGDIKRLLTFGKVENIDVVGCVVQSFQARLTATQKYIFQCLVDIFQKKLKKKDVMFLLTFSDAQTPPVLEAIEESGLGGTGHFHFNNSTLFTKHRGDGTTHDGDRHSRQSFQIQLWKENYKNFDALFTSMS